MLVRDSMRPNPVTVFPETTCSDAFRSMQKEEIDRLPVVTQEGGLVGIVTKNDLLDALPSPAALFSASEIDSLLGQMMVVSVMTKAVILVSEDCPLEEAARILVDNRIGSLPVMRGHQLVGVVTKADIFRVMMEALGGRAEGLRITIRLNQDTGELGAITDGIVQLGGTLINLSMSWGGASLDQTVTLWVEGLDPQEMLLLLEKNIGVQVIDHRQSGIEYQLQRASSPANKESLLIQDLDAKLIGYTHSR